MSIINSVNKMIHNVAGWLYDNIFVLFPERVLYFGIAIAE